MKSDYNRQRDWEDFNRARSWSQLIAKWLLGITAVIVGLVLLNAALGPQLNLYRANTEKQAVIAEQKAQSEAAEFAARSRIIQSEAEAEAETVRARGLSVAQDIISETLTEEYLRYLYIQQLDETEGQIIYIPTEAGLPILEAQRLAEDGGDE